jgi:glyoxylase-like metal-dependent hydrolase (beta-lactamase superfamily II)
MTHMDVVAGLEVIHLPGHTTGTVLFYHRPSGSLFTGDALINAVPPWVIREALSLPYPDFCDNYRQTLDNLRRFATTDLVVHRMYPGHGPIRHGPFFPELTGLLNRVCPAT